jgi:hypothetical protein
MQGRGSMQLRLLLSLMLCVACSSNVGTAGAAATAVSAPPPPPPPPPPPRSDAPPAAALASAPDAAPVPAPARSLQTVATTRVTIVSRLQSTAGTPMQLGTGVFTAFVCPYNAGLTSFTSGASNPVIAALTCNQGYYHNGGSAWGVSWTSNCRSTYTAGTFPIDYSSVAFAASAPSAPPGNGYVSTTDPTCGGAGVAGTPCFCAPISLSAVIAGTAACLQCPVGYYSTAAGATTGNCTGPCPAGRFGSSLGLLSALCSGACSAGYYCPAASSSSTQILCPAGSFCPSGAGAPTPCPAGFWCAAGASTGTANACAPGTYCPLGSTAPSPCAPPLLPTATAQLTATPGTWNWTCNAGFWGTVAVRTCSVATGVFSSSAPTCSACVAPTLPAASSFSNPNPATWAYTCNAGFYGSPSSRTCNAISGALSGAPITCAPCPNNGTYCAGGNDGTIRACPGGVYGSAGRLTSPACTGACQAGYYVRVVVGSVAHPAVPQPLFSPIKFFRHFSYPPPPSHTHTHTHAHLLTSTSPPPPPTPVPCRQHHSHALSLRQPLLLLPHGQRRPRARAPWLLLHAHL